MFLWSQHRWEGGAHDPHNLQAGCRQQWQFRGCNLPSDTVPIYGLCGQPGCWVIPALLGDSGMGIQQPQPGGGRGGYHLWVVTLGAARVVPCQAKPWWTAARGTGHRQAMPGNAEPCQAHPAQTHHTVPSHTLPSAGRRGGRAPSCPWRGGAADGPRHRGPSPSRPLPALGRPPAGAASAGSWERPRSNRLRSRPSRRRAGPTGMAGSSRP